MALYHTYRPQTFADMAETQPEVAKFFSKMLEQDNLGHIYLMVGSHGIGKTSTARILARAVNCEKPGAVVPCNECNSCKAILDGSFVDVYELDAASNRGIDDVRALQEVIRLSPVLGRKKVYIIDEVHMLTTEAFNALLKTFEEPPAQRLFLLCTTELHKVPQTIQSRAQIVRLQKPSDQIIANYVKKIVSAEGGQIEESAALAMAQAADGAFRDAAKLVEQLFVQSREITLELVSSTFVGATVSPVEFLDRLRGGRIAELQQDLFLLEQTSGNLSYFIRACITQLRNEIHTSVQQGALGQKNVGLLRVLQQALAETRYAPIAILPLELAVYESLDLAKTQVAQVTSSAKVKEVEQPVQEEKAPEMKAKEVKVKAKEKAVEVVAEETKVDLVDQKKEAPKVQVVVENSVPPEFERIRERWREVVALVKDSNASVASVLRISPPQLVDGNALVLSTTYKFHKDRLEAQKNRQLVEGALFELFGVQMRVNCQLVQQSVKKKDMENVHAVADEGLVEAAMEIFAT